MSRNKRHRRPAMSSLRQVRAAQQIESKVNDGVAKTESVKSSVPSKVIVLSSITERPDPVKIAQAGIDDPVWVYDHNLKRWVIRDQSNWIYPYPVIFDIEPEWAMDVLAHCNDRNRKIDNSRIQKYYQDLLHNNWHVIPNGIGFYSDGVLADGQHRLYSIIESEKPTPMLVMFGVADEAGGVIDEGRRRSMVDSGKVLGIEGITNKKSAAAGAVLRHFDLHRELPRSEYIDFYQRHEEAISWAVYNLPSTSSTAGVSIGPVHAVIWRAYEARPDQRDRLKRFCEILTEGMVKSEDEKTAFHLREILRNTRHEKGANAEKKKYRKVESALVAFFDHQVISKVYGYKNEQFPIVDSLELN